METVHFRTIISEDRIIRLPADVAIPAGEVEVAVTPSHTTENPRLRAVVERLANAAAELGINASGLPQDLAENHDHYVHGTPEERGWPPGYFENTFGSITDETFVRPPQGDLPPPVELE